MNFESVDFWHVQIQQEHDRKWKSFAIAEGTVAGQIVQGFFPIADNAERIREPRFAKGMAHQDNVVLIVFRQ